MNSYNEICKQAQELADKTGLDHGIEFLGDEWIMFPLPAKQYRFGRALRCQVVMCSDLNKCQVGHGPIR